MPGAYAVKRSRKNSNPFRKNKMLVRANRVPRAIRTRGTPDGYYEIPVTVYRKIYFNMSSGLWTTDPYTGAVSGSTGYAGFGVGTTLDTSFMFLGAGGNVNVTVPGFSEMQNVFDECKIARIHYEFWVAGQAHENGNVLAFTPNIWVTVDPNSIDPPSNLQTLLQYANVKCIKGDINNPTKMTLYPKLRLDVAADGAEASTATSSGANDSAKYISMAKPGAFHYGLRGWFEINSQPTEAYLGYLCVKETQIRRYKRTK